MQSIQLRFRSTILLLATVVSVPSTAVAQNGTDGAARARLGVLGGASLASVAHASDNLRLTYRDGAAGGIAGLLRIAPALSLESEILYVQKGAYSNFLASNVTFAQDYVELPLLLRVDKSILSHATMFALAGPAVSILAHCNVDIGSGPTPGTRTCGEYHQRDDYYHRFDYGALAGAGLGIRLGRETFTLGARYEWGLRALGEDAAGKRRDLSYLAGIEWPVR